MNGLDILFAVILGFSLLRGVVRGVVREVTSLMAFGAGFLLACRYAHELTPYLVRILRNPQIAAVCSYVLLFLAVFVGIIILGDLVRKFVHAVMLGWADRLGGGLLGLIKGAVISCLVLFVITLFISPRSPWVAESRLSPYLNVLTQKMIVLIPEGVKATFEAKSREMHRIWKQSPLHELEQRGRTEVNRLKPCSGCGHFSYKPTCLRGRRRNEAYKMIRADTRSGPTVRYTLQGAKLVFARNRFVSIQE